MKKWVILVIAIAIIAFIIGIVIVKNNVFSPRLSGSVLESCKTLKYNNEKGVNIVFISTKENAQKYADFLLKTAPYNTDSKLFNFYYIDDYVPKCDIYQGIALLCYSQEIIKKASSCPDDYTIVVKDEKSSIRSSSYMNILSLNSKHQLTVLAHEFGHAFANLADEYVPAEIPSKAKNCVDNCDKFSQDKDECFKGCSKDSYFRSIDSGVMRTLSSNNYGELNKNIILDKMKKEGGSALTGLAINTYEDCANQKYYLVQGEYKENNITILSKTTEQGCVGGNGAGDFEYNLIMKDDSVAKTGEFNPELIFTDLQGESEATGGALKNHGLFLLKIPIIPDSKTLEITSNGTKISEVNLYDIGARPCKQ